MIKVLIILVLVTTNQLHAFFPAGSDLWDIAILENNVIISVLLYFIMRDEREPLLHSMWFLLFCFSIYVYFRDYLQTYHGLDRNVIRSLFVVFILIFWVFIQQYKHIKYSCLKTDNLVYDKWMYVLEKPTTFWGYVSSLLWHPIESISAVGSGYVYKFVKEPLFPRLKIFNRILVKSKITKLHISTQDYLKGEHLVLLNTGMDVDKKTRARIDELANDKWQITYNWYTPLQLFGDIQGVIDGHKNTN